MRNKISGLILLLSLCSVPAFAQVDKEEKEEKKVLSRDRVDYSVFRRQILTTAEYSNERRKIPTLQKNTKDRIKVVAYVDSTDGSDDIKMLTGFIAMNVGDNSTNLYELKYDRASKKITTVKPTGETVEIEAEEKEKTPAKKTTAAPVAKKKKTDEDEDGEEEEKPVKKAKKDKDEEEED